MEDKREEGFVGSCSVISNFSVINGVDMQEEDNDDDDDDNDEGGIYDQGEKGFEDGKIPYEWKSALEQSLAICSNANRVNGFVELSNFLSVLFDEKESEEKRFFLSMR